MNLDLVWIPPQHKLGVLATFASICFCKIPPNLYYLIFFKCIPNNLERKAKIKRFILRNWILHENFKKSYVTHLLSSPKFVLKNYKNFKNLCTNLDTFIERG